MILGYDISMPAYNKFKSSNSGFTLLELLVVFSLISIITGLGFASLVAYSRSQALNQVAADIKQVVETARFNSLSSVKPASCASTKLLSYIVNFCVNSNSNCPLPLNNKGYQIQVACAGISPNATIYTKTLPTSGNFSFGPSSTCQNITFDSLTAAISGVSPSGCTLSLVGYTKTLPITVGSQGYVSF